MSISHCENGSSAPWWISNPHNERAKRKLLQQQQLLKQRDHQYGLLLQQDEQQHQYHHQQEQQQQHFAADANQRRRQSFGQDLGDLFRNIALHGYGKMLDPELNLWERLIWFLLHVTTFFVLITMLTFAWEAFVAQYVVIHLHDPLYPVEKVPFPAVSICSNNRISMRAATSYANELRAKDPMNQSVAFFLERIGYFVSMYEKLEEVYDYNRMQSFQLFLDAFDTGDNETFFNVHRIMQRLAPRCEDLLNKCFLGGKEIDCIDAHAFQDSVTVYGPCCTFNKANTLRQRSFTNRLFTADLGLTVLLNISSEDDFAPILNSDGYIVIVHSPNIYPDVTSGSTRGVFPTRSEESFVALRARIVDTESGLRTLGPMSRRCYFTDEAIQDNLIAGNYNFANCITQCRIRSMSALCGCVPFYMPLPASGPPPGIVICTLQHIQCLKRYRYKWLNVLTQRVAIPGLERSMEDALYCPQCLPSCVDVQYDLSLMSLPTDRVIVSLNLQKGNANETMLNLSDMSVLRVYFGELHAQYYRRTVGNTWFEAFSTVGNICSIFVGFSMVAIGELLYFLIKQLTAAVRAFVQQQQRQQHRHGQQQKQRRQRQQQQQHEQQNDGYNNGNAMQLFILP